MTSVPRLPKQVRFVESVRSRLGPERGFLFDQQTGRVYSLNATGTLAASQIQSGAPVEDIVAALVEAFEIDAATARRDLARFAAHLVEEKLAQTDG